MLVTASAASFSSDPDMVWDSSRAVLSAVVDLANYTVISVSDSMDGYNFDSGSRQYAVAFLRVGILRGGK